VLIWVSGKDKCCHWFNKTLLDFTGRTMAQAIGNGWLEGVHCDDLAQSIACYNSHFETRQPFTLEYRLKRYDGDYRWMLDTAVPRFDSDGGFAGYIGSCIDIHERKQIEAALLRSNNDLERFAYSISHDMRQPLRAIASHLQLLARSLKGKLHSEEEENLGFALEGAKRLDAMILSLLDYSRVGRKMDNKRWQHSRPALDEALAFLNAASTEANATLTITGTWPSVFASYDELTRLFLNLISNALKYREARQQPRINISSTVIANTWQVRIEDNGIGIDPKQIDRLFQFFSRLQSRARFEGTGMGLALCRRIVEQHQGTIWVESAGEGFGSCFIFELPLSAVEAT
jgi:PAS domain S-box-containing protein